MDLAGDDPTHIKQFISDLSLRPHIALDGLQSTLSVRFRRVTMSQQRRPSLDCVQRRSKLVRQDRKKFVLQVAETLRFLARGSL